MKEERKEGRKERQKERKKGKEGERIEGMKVHRRVRILVLIMKVERRVRILVLIMKGDEDFIVNKNKQNCDTAKIDRKIDRLIHKHTRAHSYTHSQSHRHTQTIFLKTNFYDAFSSVLTLCTSTTVPIALV